MIIYAGVGRVKARVEERTVAARAMNFRQARRLETAFWQMGLEAGGG